MTPFDSLHMVSYYGPIVTSCLNSWARPRVAQLTAGPRSAASIDSAASAAPTLGGQTDRHDLPTGQPAVLPVSSCKLGNAPFSHNTGV